MTLPPEALRLLRLAGPLACCLVAAPVAFGSSKFGMAFSWLGPLVAFVALYAWTTSRLESRNHALLAGLAAQSAAVIVMVATQSRGLEGTLLVLVAMELGLVTPRRLGLLWITAQSLALFWAIQHHWALRSAFLLTPPYLGFQVLAFRVMELLRRESEARSDLARTNADLVSTRELLAESVRLGERLRIARELHDAMGHHLAGLSLNLEVLAQRGTPSAPLTTAQSLTRLLLDDVESVVGTLASGRGIDLSRALAALAAGIPRPRVHVEAQELALPDPEQAHALLRCCQEIVTNAVKHAGAANLWIAIRVHDGVLELTAHDDGSGASSLGPGQGLSGMRQRLEEMGGALDLETSPGAGFRLRATLPRGGA
jgi:signal transduction histidine kinase